MVKAKAGGRTYGGDSYILNPMFLVELYKMDSFLKESQGFHHANLRSSLSFCPFIMSSTLTE